MLLILDGLGLNPSDTHNAFHAAKTPVLDRLLSSMPHATLRCGGLDVGLPEGQMGNSEVGHLNIGAGRVVYQDLVRINRAMADGTFKANENVASTFTTLARTGGALHLLGLLSDGGVHSHQNHLFDTIRAAEEAGVKKIWIHALLDGRDTAPRGAGGSDGYMAALERAIAASNVTQIASVAGRYWTMDRDKRWERIQRGYDVITNMGGDVVDSASAAIEASYAADVADEFVAPVRTRAWSESAIEDRDRVFFFNFRPDRMRQIVRALQLEEFDGFDRAAVPAFSSALCMTEYDATFRLPVVFAPESLHDVLGEVVSAAGVKQLRIAETEKYPHVTYFLNGGREEPFEGEDRELIPSPRDVATYDEKPEMSAFEVTEILLKHINAQTHHLIVCNYANCDMVGHTGDFDAAVKAVETVDTCLGRVLEAGSKKGFGAFVIADHGNAEMMQDSETGNPHTAHTLNPVPAIFVPSSDDAGDFAVEDGILADVMPTLLARMQIKTPDAVTGRSLISEK
jgi:2,3-bisphosphoglycerate-independent phosphoglycerate mutase